MNSPLTTLRAVALTASILVAGAFALPSAELVSLEPAKTVLAAPALASAATVELDFESLAEGSLRRHGLKDRTPETFSWEDYFAGHFVHMEVGLFDLYIETDEFGNAEDAQRFLGVGSSLAEMQVQWLHWVDPTGEKFPDSLAAAKEMAKFLKKAKAGPAAAKAKTVKSGSDGGVRRDGATDLWPLLGAKDFQLTQFTKFSKFMQTSGGLGLEREAKPEPMVLYPSRQRYVEAIALVGWSRPQDRNEFWNNKTLVWTNFYLNEWRFVAMAFSPANPGEGTYTKGTPMEKRFPGALNQQMCQLGALAMLDNFYGGRIPPNLAGGLSINLVVDQYEECNTRVDGDLRERRKGARSWFVPGGLSEGGLLPPNLADSRWREHHGKFHFVKKLKESQKEGLDLVKRKERKGKVRYFMLLADDEVEKAVFQAPVLGMKGETLAQVEDRFYGDRLEFARSYSSGFLYWLRENAGGKKPADSRVVFANLLTHLGTLKVQDSGSILAEQPKNIFEGVFETFYEKPLSEPELEPGKSLEGAFLHWLPKGR